ncbi:MAG: hypothetical protein DHS20C21_13930 [Gemmatimonadota bacterium]|nr:MAG: hypothetical protein DHS20C21_13930 [Gemmatimonadota bacterium]
MSLVHRLLLLIAVGSALATGGCASIDKLTLTTAARLNTCDGSEPHPVVVRIYYLKNSARFKAADFPSLWDQDRNTLGDDRLDLIEETLNPREELPLVIKRSDEAKEATAIGIVANFCDPGEGCWRQVVPITGKKSDIRIHFDEGCLSID